ncbi:MAG: hypothetical protein J1E00_02840 [Oscillospiraceae bacterium]|nr:hypothetical protein [Oscillospiraceae bacterium]
MKKSFSALLAVALLAFAALCAFAVQAEESGDSAAGTDGEETAVVYNFLAALTDTDGSYYTVKNNDDGSVTVTLKQEATEEAPIMLATYSDAKIDLSNPAFFAADFVTESADVDFRLNYTRKDYEGTEKNGIANLYFTGAKKAAEYTKSSTDTSIVWDFASYVSGAKRYEDNQHEFKNLAITAAKAGDVITFNTLAIVSDENAMTVGTPLVGASGTGETSSEEPSSEEPSSEETTSEASSEEPSSEESSVSSENTSSGPVTAGDAGVILYVVLAVLAAAGAIAMVRMKQE